MNYNLKVVCPSAAKIPTGGCYNSGTYICQCATGTLSLIFYYQLNFPRSYQCLFLPDSRCTNGHVYEIIIFAIKIFLWHNILTPFFRFASKSLGENVTVCNFRCYAIEKKILNKTPTGQKLAIVCQQNTFLNC